MSGQDCDGAWSQAPIRSLLALPRALLAPPRIESTDQAEGMMPVSERVRPEPRWPGIHHRSLRNLFHLTCTMRDSLDSGVRRNDVIEIWRSGSSSRRKTEYRTLSLWKCQLYETSSESALIFLISPLFHLALFRAAPRILKMRLLVSSIVSHLLVRLTIRLNGLGDTDQV